MLKDLRRQERSTYKKNSVMRAAQQVTGLAGYAVGAYALFLVVRGSMTLGTFTAIMMLLSSMLDPLHALMALAANLMLKKIPLDRVGQLARSRESGRGLQARAPEPVIAAGSLIVGRPLFRISPACALSKTSRAL